MRFGIVAGAVILTLALSSYVQRETDCAGMVEGAVFAEALAATRSVVTGIAGLCESQALSKVDDLALAYSRIDECGAVCPMQFRAFGVGFDELAGMEKQICESPEERWVIEGLQPVFIERAQELLEVAQALEGCLKAEGYEVRPR
jgi:hypothetical protein